MQRCSTGKRCIGVAVALLFFLALYPAAPSRAGTTGTLVGTVTDAAGKPIADVRVAAASPTQSGVATTDEDRALLLMRSLDDASHEDLAHLFHSTVPAVKSRLHRVRLHLRQVLDEKLRGRPPSA